MRLLGTIVLGMAAALSAAAQQPSAAPFIIENGGMTQGARWPVGWTNTWTGKGKIAVHRDTTIAREGPASLCISSVGGPALGQTAQLIAAPAAPAGSTVAIAGWIRSAGKIKASVAIQAYTKDYHAISIKPVKSIQNDTDWTAFNGSVTLPPEAARFGVVLLIDGDGKAWLDEVHEASSRVDPGKPFDVLITEPAPAGKPWEEAWGFYPRFPTAWQLMHKSLLERTARGNVGLAFIGNSITQGWDKQVFEREFGPFQAVNYGIGGDSTRQVLWRISHGEFDGIHPKLIVLMIGTNNLYDDNNAGTDAEIARGVEEVVRRLRQKLPQSKILLLAILPRQNEYLCSRIEKINTLIRKLADGQTVRWLDLTDRFEISPGKLRKELYAPDELHLVTEGYEAFADGIRNIVEEACR